MRRGCVERGHRRVLVTVFGAVGVSRMAYRRRGALNLCPADAAPLREPHPFDFVGRTARRHRREIRAYTGFRECSVTDAETLAAWLTVHIAGVERRQDRVREELLARCQAELIEPPTPDRVMEIVRSALYRAEQTLVTLIAERVEAPAVTRLQVLIAVSDDEDVAEDLPTDFEIHRAEHYDKLHKPLAESIHGRTA